MSEGINSLYQHPEADLTLAKNEEKPILRFKRFSAWGVFFLSLITLGVYDIYWLISRVNLANSLTKKAEKISFLWIYLYIGLIVMEIIVRFFSTDPMVINVSLISSAIVRLIISFKLRDAITEIIYEGTKRPVIVGAIKTFFFNIIYLQYKINEAIDKQQANHLVYR